GGSWAENGSIIAGLKTLTGLSVVSSEGGKPTPLTELGYGELSNRWPQVLPSGQDVLFSIGNSYAAYDEAAIAVVSLKDHRKKTVFAHAGMYPRYLPSGHLTYVTNGSLFAVPFDLVRLEARGAATLLEEVSSNTALGAAQMDVSRSGILA